MRAILLEKVARPLFRLCKPPRYTGAAFFCIILPPQVNTSRERRGSYGYIPAQSPRTPAPHPRRQPRYDRPLTLENLEAVFQGCADFMKREVYLHGDRERVVTVCYLLGMTRNERLSDYILRPLAQDDALSRVPMDEVFKRLRYGALYNLAALVRETLDEVADDLVAGSCVIFFPGKSQALTFPVVTEEKRGVGEPSNEPALKGCGSPLWRPSAPTPPWSAAT